MMHSRSSTSFVLLFWVSIVLTFITMGSVVFANTKYTVNKGDTLFGIAQTYHTSVAAIMKDNQLHTTLLQIDQILWIPSASPTATHHAHLLKTSRVAKHQYHEPIVDVQPVVAVVQPGDTLWQIAMNHHISVESLMVANHLNSSLIFPGQKLTVSEPETRRNLPMAINQLGLLHSINRRAAIINGIPLEFIPIYQAAGQKYGIPWTILAAIHKTETDFSRKPEVSSEGAEGPMQFMPSTFARYAVTAPGSQGAPNINNLDDAIYTAAHMLAANGYAKNPSAALYQYDHSMAYVDSVEALAHSYQ